MRLLCDFANEGDEGTPFIRDAPAKYARAFVETETDERDATYFLIHQLDVIEKAIDELHLYLQRKTAEVRDIEGLLQDTVYLNGRQLALLTDAVRNPKSSYSFESHAKSHRVSHETARSDLRELEQRELLVKRRVSRQHRFEPAPNLLDRLKESPA
jgi:Fic family protein